MPSKRRTSGDGFRHGKRRLAKGAQMSFADRKQRKKDGALRARPGPKPGPRPCVRHRTRAEHDEKHPLHLTLRAAPGLPSFRSQVIWKAFDKAFRRTRRDDFHIIEFSVQSNHVHLIVEGGDKLSLANGMKSFSVRANRLVNAALKNAGVRPSGRGRVWGDRYHRRDLTSPRQVRNALVYCINNYKKHQNVRDGGMRIDTFSSARWFQGWVRQRDESEDEPRPTEEAAQPLLRYLWTRHGLIHPGEAPTTPG